MAYPHKWSPISYKSSAGQRKHIGQRPMLYRWTTQPRNIAVFVLKRDVKLQPSNQSTSRLEPHQRCRTLLLLPTAASAVSSTFSSSITQTFTRSCTLTTVTLSFIGVGGTADTVAILRPVSRYRLPVFAEISTLRRQYSA